MHRGMHRQPPRADPPFTRAARSLLVACGMKGPAKRFGSVGGSMGIAILALAACTSEPGDSGKVAGTGPSSGTSGGIDSGTVMDGGATDGSQSDATARGDAPRNDSSLPKNDGSTGAARRSGIGRRITTPATLTDCPGTRARR